MNVVCDICSGLHDTQQHDLDKLTAREFYAGHYTKVCHTVTDWYDFAEAYAAAKRDGVPKKSGSTVHAPGCQCGFCKAGFTS